MGWLRSLERLLEERLEGGTGVQMHALEASRAAVRTLLDSRRRCGNMTLVPNLVMVPFPDLEGIPEGFSEEVLRLVSTEMQQRGFRTLGPFEVRTVGPEAGLEDVEVRWTDGRGIPALGMVEGVEGPAGGGLWGISCEGVVIGRGPEADLRLVDPGLSRQHLRLHVTEEGKVVLEDLQSHNGTRLGRRQVTEPTPVKSGTRVGIGESVLRVWVLPGLAARLREADE